MPKFKSRLLTHFIGLAVNFVVVLSNRADFVIASKPLPTSCLPAIFCKIIRRKAILDIDDLEYGYWKGTKFENVLKIFDRIFPGFFDRVTVHTNGLREYVSKGLKIPVSNIIFLPQGIDYGMFKNAGTGLKERLNLGKKKVMIYTAHLGPAAKLDFIFSVLEGLIEKRDDLMLVVVGGGEYLNHYKKLAKSMGIEDHVIFTGQVDHEYIPQYLAISDVAVNYLEDSPANKYRSSIKIREYLASGVPVICNTANEDLKQFSDYVNSFGTGDLEGMKRQILKAIEKPDKEKTTKGREFVRKWDWPAIVENFEKELSKI